MMINKISLELNPSQVEALVDKLPAREKIRLVRKLTRQTWAKQLDNIVTRIRKRFKESPISDKEIQQEIEEVRRQIYGARRR